MGNFMKHIHPLLRRERRQGLSDDSNYAVLNALDNVLNEAEKDTIKSKIQSSLETATGEYLDHWGDWFGIYRAEGEDDEHYREHIIRHTLLPRGTIQSIIDAIKWFLDDNDANIEIYEPWKNIFYTNKSLLNGEDHLMGYYYRFAIIDITIDRPFPPEIRDIIWAFKPAGVLFYVGYDSGLDITAEWVESPYENMTVHNTQELDRLTGVGVNIKGNMKANDINEEEEVKNIFHTNRSSLNGTDVLAGAFDHNRDYIHLYSESIGGRNFFDKSDAEITASREFVNDVRWDMAPIIDKHGLDQWYTISFDIKSKVAGDVRVYAQNGSGAKYRIGVKDVQVTSEYQRFSTTFKPTKQNDTETRALLAFYGTYDTGRIPVVRNVKFELGNKATPWVPSPTDLSLPDDMSITTHMFPIVDNTTLQDIKANTLERNNVSYNAISNKDSLTDRVDVYSGNIYMVYNVRGFIVAKYKKEYEALKGKNPDVVNKKDYADFLKEPTLSISLSSLATTAKPTTAKVNLVDFTTGKRHTIRTYKLTQTQVSENIDLASLVDYINSEGLVVVEISMSNTESTVVDIDYVNLTFKNVIASGYGMSMNLSASNKTEIEIPKFKAWSWSADGTDRFTTKYPRENLASSKHNGTVSKPSDYWFVTIAEAKTQTGFIWKPDTEYTIVMRGRVLEQGSILRWYVQHPPSYDLNQYDGIKSLTSSTVKKTFRTPKWDKSEPASLSIYNYTKTGGVQLDWIMVIEGTVSQDIYTPSPKDDFDNAYPKYVGFSDKDSSDHKDYIWRPV